MLKPLFNEYNTIYVTVSEDYIDDVSNCELYVVTDANKDELINTFKLAVQSFKLVIKIKPDVVVSTGAAVGVMAIIFAKLMGKKTIWIDSIANVKTMSLSARIVKPFCDLWLTQWQDLARTYGANYAGKVL